MTRETAKPESSSKVVTGGRRAYLVSPFITVQVQAITVERAADEIERDRWQTYLAAVRADENEGY